MDIFGSIIHTMSKKILVTGGAGFVGSHLIEKLLEEKSNEVYSLDNYFTGKKENHREGATYIEGETKDIDKLVDFKPDLVFHLGEYSRVEQSFDDWDKVWKYNVDGTARVLDFCLKNSSKIIYAGSSTKFGDGGLARDNTPYAWTKAVNTELVINFSKWYGLKYAITYFYNVYGPREIGEGDYATLMAIFKRKFLAGEPLTIVSPGTQVRYFTHVDDIVKGLILVSEKGEGDNFGLGAQEGYSILDVAKMFGGEIEMLPERKGNRMDSPLNTARSIEIGWAPSMKLENYINGIKQK